MDNNPLLEQKRMAAADNKRISAKDSSENKRFQQMSAWEVGEEVKKLENVFLKGYKDCCVVGNKGCYSCKHHTTRTALFEECRRLHFPVWVKEALSSNLLYWTKNNVHDTVRPVVNWSDNRENGYCVQYDCFLHLLPKSSPDIHGKSVSSREINQNQKIVPFLLDTVPAIIASAGLKCGHCVKTFPSIGTRYDIACNMPNVVNKHRRKR